MRVGCFFMPCGAHGDVKGYVARLSGRDKLSDERREEGGHVGVAREVGHGEPDDEQDDEYGGSDGEPYFLSLL